MLISVSSVILIFMIINRENKRVADLKKVVDVLCDIRNHTLHKLIPFTESVKECCIIDVDFSDLSEYGNKNPEEVWRLSVNKTNMSLSQDEKDIVTAFGISMCRCSREQISEYADKYISQINKIYTEVKEKKDQKIKIMTMLVVSASLITVLLFL